MVWCEIEGTCPKVSRAREKLAVFVKADRHHAIGGIECLLDPIAVMDVYINIQHTIVISMGLEHCGGRDA